MGSMTGFPGMLVCSTMRLATTMSHLYYEVESPTEHLLISLQTLVEETASREIYEDTHTLLREMLKEQTFKIDAGFSFKLSPSEQSMSNMSVNAEAGVEYTRKKVIKDVTEYSTIKVNVSVSAQFMTD